jgi:pentatricopeptide repeat protein
MTNTLHRQGEIESLKRDYILFIHTARGINREGSAEKIREFMRICLKYHPVNMGDVKQGSVLRDGIDPEGLFSTMGEGTVGAAVFTDLDTLRMVIEELIRADLGISINVSGLLDEVQACCRKAGITRHSAEHSLGVWGAKDRLPEREILEFNTMCGHGMVSFNLIRKMIEQVRLRRMTPKQAARMLAKCCACGAFNPDRAEALFERMRERGFLYSKR